MTKKQKTEVALHSSAAEYLTCLKRLNALGWSPEIAPVS